MSSSPMSLRARAETLRVIVRDGPALLEGRGASAAGLVSIVCY